MWSCEVRRAHAAGQNEVPSKADAVPRAACERCVSIASHSWARLNKSRLGWMQQAARGRLWRGVNMAWQRASRFRHAFIPGETCVRARNWPSPGVHSLATAQVRCSKRTSSPRHGTHAWFNIPAPLWKVSMHCRMLPSPGTRITTGGRSQGGPAPTREAPLDCPRTD